MGGDCQHAMNFLRQLFHPERFGDVRQVVAFEKLPCLCGDNIAGDEQEAFTQGITGALQRLVEMLPIETGHLHVADDQVEGLPGRAVQGFAAILQHSTCIPSSSSTSAIKRATVGSSSTTSTRAAFPEPNASPR